MLCSSSQGSSQQESSDNFAGEWQRSCGGRAVGVMQHGVERTSKVVGKCTAVVLRQRHQAGQDQQQEEEQLQGEGSS